MSSTRTSSVQRPMANRPFWWAVAGVGIVFALVVLLPHIWQRLETTYPFQGIEMMGADSETHYASRVREIADGFWKTGNTFYAQSKDQPYLQPPLPEIGIAVLSFLLPTDLVHTFVLSKGLFTFLLVICMTGFFVCVTGRKWESLLAVSILVFATFLLTSPWNALSLLLQASPAHDFLRFARPINPLWTDTWFFLMLWLLAAWLQQRTLWKIMLASLCTVILLYSYVWAWTYVGLTLTLLFLFLLWNRDYRRCRDLLYFAALFALLSIPFLMNLWESAHHPWYSDTIVRLGLVHKRESILGVWIVLFLLLSAFSNRLYPRIPLLVPALALAGIGALNQQLLTGTYLQPHHYYWYFVHPLASVFFLVAFFSYIRRFVPRIINIQYIFVLTLIGAICMGTIFQWRSYQTHREFWGEKQELRSILDFLDEETDPGDVVFAQEESSVLELIPVYTSADVYTSGNANNYLTPHKKAQDILFFQLWLEGITLEEAEEHFFTDLRYRISSRIYSMYYRTLLGGYDRIPDDIIAKHLLAYQQFLILSDVEKITRYPLHYLVVTPEDPQTRSMGILKKRGTEVFQSGDYTVLRMKNP